MILEYGQDRPRTRRPRFLIARVIITMLVMGFFSLAVLVSAHANAMYAPSNMTRQQFEAAARFSAWEQRPEGFMRSFVLQTPEATITGWDRAITATDLDVPFGKVHLKARSLVKPLAFAILLPVTVVWIIPWLVGLALAQLRRPKPTAS